MLDRSGEGNFVIAYECVIASSKKAIAELGWKPYYTNVKDIIRTAWEWNLKVK